MKALFKKIRDGDVMIELQGPDNRIMYLISFIESLKRIKINNKVIEKLEVEKEERGFSRE